MAKVFSVQRFDRIDGKHTYLVLISPEAIPHLAIVHREKYYSLTNLEAILGQPFEPYFKALSRTRKKLLFLDLGEIAETPESHFATFKQANTSSVTCFEPIRDYLLGGSPAQFIFELIPALYDQHKIIGASHCYLDNLLDENGDFVLNRYSRADIYSYIQSMNEQHAKKRSDISPDN